jgi:hypothetical protein
MTEAERRETRRVHRVRNARYSYVVLAVMCLILGAGSFLYTNFRSDHDVKTSNHKFCQLLDASLAGSSHIHKPADPKKDPSREKLYESYVIVKNLSHSLGCS